jgi:adenylate/guanylate cyclase family protein
VCSVLFCDVVGFTPLSEARDPEAVRELLSQYFAVARTVITRYGGVVEKFIGDAVMAVWGTRVASEEDAERAQPRPALGHVRAALAHAGTLGISHECLRWAWPLAARAAHDLGDTAATGELLVLLDGYQPGYLAPMLRAERDLARARLAAADDGPDAAAAFAAAITSLREQSTPYHLAHGLLDHAVYLQGTDEDEAAAAAIDEAAGVGERLRCQPLLDRVETIQPARSRTAAS